MTELYSIEKKLKSTIFNFLKDIVNSTEATQITLQFIKDGKINTLKKILSKIQLKKVIAQYDNYLMMKEAEKLTKELPQKRIRKQAEDSCKKYFDKVIEHKSQCGKNGGFIKGSGAHYERDY